jgi:hypothetical protein
MLAATLVLSAAGAGAAVRPERIDHITVDLTARSYGVLEVVETIDYDFGSARRPGIIRVIPNRKRVDAGHERLYPISIRAVTASGGASAKYETTQNGPNFEVRIGAPGASTTGRHRYVISYIVVGAYDRLADHDELTWTAVAGEWSVPVAGVAVRLHAPGQLRQVGCAAGDIGARTACTSASVRPPGTEARFTNTALKPMQAVTVAAAMPTGTITNAAPLLVVSNPVPRVSVGTERIEHITVELTAHRDGTLDVVEIIAYDFGANERHGIIRRIPDRRRFDKHHDRRYPITVTSITASAGTSTKRKVSQKGFYLEIRIGDSKQTTTGRHTYKIAYTVAGAFDRYRDYDELNWNAVGTEWSVPIGPVTVRLRAPAAITRVGCEAGYTGSQLSCTSARVAQDATRATFTNAYLNAAQGVTVVAAMPRGTITNVAPILAKHWTIDQAFTPTRANVGGAVALAVVLLGGIFFLAWRVGRDRRYVGSATDAVFGNPTGADEPVSVFDDHTTPVEYVPPDQLRPGQIGTLVDEVAGPLDVSATIVDLAVRKYLTIEEIPKEGLFGKPDWKLTRLELNDPLLKYERMLLDALFAGTEGTVLLSSLKTKFHESLLRVESALYDDAVARGWFLRRPDRVRTFWNAMAILAVVGGIGITILLAWRTSRGLLGLPIVLAGFVLLACAHAMPRRTSKGTATTRRALGFRRFIVESERDRARFAEQQHLFSEYLPYAIVFGVVDRWAKTFEGLAAPPDVSWYHSSTAFNAIVFSHAINGFATTTVGTMQSTPAGSGGSGFSGGGSVGGGGGGGGGGSW